MGVARVMRPFTRDGINNNNTCAGVFVLYTCLYITKKYVPRVYAICQPIHIRIIYTIHGHAKQKRCLTP